MARKFFIDPQRCIGCRACMAACQECDTHRGVSMIFIDTLDTFWSPQTSPTVCMHCVNPPCANVCPVDAIKQDENGIVPLHWAAEALAHQNTPHKMPALWRLISGSRLTAHSHLWHLTKAIAASSKT